MECSFVWGLRIRCPSSKITPVPESPQDPLPKTAGRLAQLGHLGLVAVVEPYRSWGASPPAPSHAAACSGNNALAACRRWRRPYADQPSAI